MKTLTKIGFGAALSALAVTGALAQMISPLPQVQSVSPTDLFQDVTGGMPTAQNFYASGPLMSGYFAQASQTDSFLIAGDANQNLWQRGTTGSSVTTTITYGGPDRWAYWSGTNTAMTVSRDTTAAALPTGTTADFKMQRTAAQTGVVQMCMTQEVPTSNAVYLAGHTVSLDFNVYTGANFSATAMNAYIITGTGTDEGVSKMAFAFNAGGGGSSTWTGQATATSGAFTGMAVSTAYRVAAVANIPAAATEVGVLLCYTPVGTASTTDALYFSNIELRKADHLSGFVNTASAYNVVASTNNPQQGSITVNPTAVGLTSPGSVFVSAPGQNAIIPAFTRRPTTIEQYLQWSFYYQWNDLTTAALPIGPAGYYNTTTACQIQFPLPAPLYKAPTIVNSAITVSTFTVAQSGGTPAAGAALAGSGNSGLILTVGSNTNAVTGSATNFSSVNLTFITGAKTQFAACQLLSTNVATAAFGVSSEL